MYQVSVLSVESVDVKNGQVISTEWGYAACYPVSENKIIFKKIKVKEMGECTYSEQDHGFRVMTPGGRALIKSIRSPAGHVRALEAIV